MAVGLGSGASVAIHLSVPRRKFFHTRASQWGYHEVSTKFVDDTICEMLATSKDRASQVVLCSTIDQPKLHRLATWSALAPLVIFDVSPSTSKHDVPSRKNKNFVLRHVTCDSLHEDWTPALVEAGYRGDRPSIWALQGLNLRSNDLLGGVSTHAMKGSYIIGDVLRGALLQNFPSAAKAEKVLLRRKLLGYGLETEAAHTLSCGGDDYVFFVSKQLRLSVEQVCYGLKEIEMAEEVEEDGFDDW
ncbi:uncharacterized protein LOC112343259 [Selaginella moellendorffii]|uniref:uncharacterized protein LOC112343259 n=1 Tax=Selaginella moellendorffii TaxID=88036 RepID=UPI000D1C8C81|nr:uncharacterized protein LOC112343259 [Selaginella moellendorffii]|eukprot:XP_024522181.1 uncharacterized protein LOC112343259 [Selaginella moellendorffii]